MQIENKAKSYLENPDSDLGFFKILDGKNTPLKTTLNLESLGEVYSSEYGHSVHCIVNDEEEQKMITMMEDMIFELIPETITLKDFLKDNKFFMKLQTKDGKYKAIFDPPMTPEKPIIHASSSLQVECKPSLWINNVSKTAGLCLQIIKITVDGGAKKRVRKR